MGGFKHTGVADATLRTQYASAAQAQDSSMQLLSSVTGVDTITALVTPTISAYAAGQRFTFVPAGANTGAATINISGLGAKAIVKGNTGAALIAGDLVATAPFTIVYNGTSFFLQTVVATANPTATVGPAAVNGTAATLMRSDAAPAINLTATYAWTGPHTFTNVGAVALTVNGATAGTAVASFAGQATGIPIQFMDLAAAPNNLTAAIIGLSTSALAGVNGDLVLVPRTSAAGALRVYTGNAGLSTQKYSIENDGGLLATGATGGSQGLGSANFSSAFINGDPIRSIPQNSKSAAYTTVAADANKHVYHPSADTTARVWTIDSNANVAYPIGTAITFVNDTSGGVITIAITADTLVLAGAGTTGSRTLAANGIATALKVTSTRWIINGTGLT